MLTQDTMTILTACGVALLYLIGALHVLHALMNVRTSQGTIAWIICLITLPYIAIPLYWILGRNRFSGYVRARRADDERLRNLAAGVRGALQVFEVKEQGSFSRATEKLGGLPPVRGNELRLLVNGDSTFASLFKSIESARSSIVVNFFIVKNDELGTRFRDALIEKARGGVQVLFLFDEIGSNKLPNSYLEEMHAAGVQCRSFGSNRYWWSRLQVNFRNHRKIVVVDGQVAYLGGLNIGNEYLEGHQRLGIWRDTHIRIDGPAALAAQLVFLEDWYWATDDVPELETVPHAREADQDALILPTGPADPQDSWQLFVVEAANMARERLWIASPYFVPDFGVLAALQAAALRGVDVRILLPHKPDHLLVYLSSFSFYEQTLPLGVKLFRYEPGFLHQKVVLTDRHAAVGSANLDNRSFRLNFEITAFSEDPKFVGEVAAMLEEDFRHSCMVEMSDFENRSFLFRAACRAARLLAPIQ